MTARPLSERPFAQEPGEEPSLTKQSFKESTDINNIMARYQKTGVLDHVSKFSGTYGDLDGQTFTEQQVIIANAISMFEELPSKARAFFEHSPANFLDYVDDLGDDPTPQQLTTLAELGLTDIVAPNPSERDEGPQNGPQADPGPPETTPDPSE